MLEIKLEVISKKDRYTYRGEQADFVVEIELPELINAIDLNAIKNVLAQKALQLQAEKDAVDEDKQEQHAT